MLWLADRIREQQQVARDMIEESEAGGVEDIIKGVTQAVLQVDDNNRFGPQGQRDAFIRCSLPQCSCLHCTIATTSPP